MRHRSDRYIDINRNAKEPALYILLTIKRKTKQSKDYRVSHMYMCINAYRFCVGYLFFDVVLNVQDFSYECVAKIGFLLLNQNICCGYSKEPKHMLQLMGKKIFRILRSKIVLI